MGYCVSDLILISLFYAAICCGKQCLKNDDIGWREGNIYNCTDTTYPVCCEVYKKFTCCEEPHVKNAREQLQLWGSVSLMIAVLFIVYMYYNRDSQTNCNCFCYTCAYFFKRLKGTFMRRKHSFNVQDERVGHGASNKQGVLATNRLRNEATDMTGPPNQYNSFEQFTVT